MASDITLDISGSNPANDVTLDFADKFNTYNSPVTYITNVTGNSAMTVAGLRSSVGLQTSQSVTTNDFGGGTWYYAGLSDGQVADNTGTVIITADNKVWKRAYSGEVYAKWFINGNGVTDNTQGLKNAIARGGDVILTEQYIVSDTLLVPSNTRILGINGASIFVADGTNKILFNIVDASNVIIDGLIIDGNESKQNKTGVDPLNLPEFWSGINILNSKNVTVRNCIIKNCNGDGITIEGRYIVTSLVNANKNVSIISNEIFHSGRNGVSVIHSDGFEISGNTIYDQKAYTSTLGSGIDIEPNIGNGSEVWVARNGIISGNNIYGNNEGVNFAGSAVVSSQILENIKVDANSIHDNVVRNINIYSLDATKFSTKGIIISSNNLKGTINLANSVFFNGCHSNVSFTNNDISISTTAILIYRSSEVSVESNSIEDYGTASGGSGIELFGSSLCSIKRNRISNGNTDSSFIYGITITSSQVDYENADNIIEGNTIRVTKAGKYIFAGIVGVANNIAWDVIKRNNINGNNLKGVTAANFLFVNSRTSDNLVGVNYSTTPLIPNHAVNTLVTYNYTADASIETADLPTTNISIGERRFDNTKLQPTSWDGNKWNTLLIDGYNFGAKEVQKILTSSFPPETANQKIDVLFPSASFLGEIEVSIVSGFIGSNATGIISKRFGVGYNPGNALFSHTSRYTEAIGEILDDFSISDLSWDTSTSKYRVTINQLQVADNPITVRVRAYSTDAAAVKTLYNGVALGTVYVGASSTADAAIEFKYPVRGVAGVSASDFVTKGQLHTALTITSPDAIDLGTTMILLNEIKAKLNAI